MAFENLPANQDVIDKVLARTKSVGTHAGFVALRELEPYTGKDEIFDEEQAKAYARRKAKEAEAKYLEERIAGKHNDTESKKPGLTALVTGHAKSRIEKVFAIRSQGNLFGVEISVSEDTKENSELFIVRLPEGGYAEISPITMQFTDIVEPVGEENVRITDAYSSSVRMSSHDVVTIVGDAGEYWQNIHYNLDGTYKQ